MNRTAWMNSTNLNMTRQQPWNLPEVGLSRTANPSWLMTLADGFAPISLVQMDSVALLDRTDTKFVMTSGQLMTALAALQKDYKILSVHGQRLNHYRTLYFDTPAFDLYKLHINDRAERYKVRSREYTDSGQSFLEVKHKTRKDRTIKDRLSTSRPITRINPDTEDWLEGIYPLDARQLEPKLWNTFTRITLVSIRCCERVTIDVDLNFNNSVKRISLCGLAVVEVKRDSQNHTSPFLMQMRAQRIHPMGFSKYCIGVCMLYDHVKKNELKPKILQINKLMQGAICHE